MPTWSPLGTHRYYCDSDILFAELHGDVDLELIQELWPIAGSIEQTFGYVISVFDARDAKSITPAARRFIGDRNRERTLVGPVLMLGSGFSIRTLVMLLQQAARLFGKRPAPVHFYAQPAELAPLLAAQRLLFAPGQRH